MPRVTVWARGPNDAARYLITWSGHRKKKGHRHFKALAAHAHWLKSVEDFRAICWRGDGRVGAPGLRLKTKSRSTPASQEVLLNHNLPAFTVLTETSFFVWNHWNFLLRWRRILTHVWPGGRPRKYEIISVAWCFFGGGTCLEALLGLSHCASSGFIAVKLLYAKSPNLYFQAKMMRPDCNVYLQSKGGGLKRRSPPGSQSSATLQVTLAPITPKM